MFKIFRSKALDRFVAILLNVAIISGVLGSTVGYSVVYAQSEGTINVALNKPVTVKKTLGGDVGVNEDRPVGMANDGIIPTGSAAENYCDFGEDSKRESLYLEVDLGKTYDISELKMWRYWTDERTYDHTTIVVSENGMFVGEEKIIYNSDSDNVHGFGVGKDAKYAETKEGKRWEVSPEAKGRYVRVYVYGVKNGGTTNHIVELEVYAKDQVATVKKPFTNAPKKLKIPSYYDIPGREPDQNTHPDVVYFPQGWNGYKYWMAFTPNMTYTSLYENTSIVASNDNINWEVPEGLTNPIDPQPESTRYHNCDADMIYNSKTDELWVYWNWADDEGGGVGSEIRVSKSGDGVNWSNAETVIKSPKRYDMLSPAIIYDEYRDIYLMWSNNTGDVGYHNGGSNFVEMRYSEDGMVWSEPTKVVNFLGKDENGKQLAPWHQDVQYISEFNEYWAISQCFSLPGNPDGSVLHFTKSKDGINWTPVGTKPILSPGKKGSWDDRQIYRTSFIYDNSENKGYGKGNLRLWYSALQNYGVGQDAQLWGIGYTDNSYDETMSALIGDELYTEPDLIPVIGIEISAKNPNLNVGEKTNVTTTILPANASDIMVKYESSDSSIVKVGAFGEITAIKAGTATIRAISKDGAKTSEVEITVLPKDNTTDMQWQRFDDTNESIIYSQGWTIEDNARYASAKDEFAKMTFYGTQVKVIGQKDSNFGYADVYIDGTKVGVIDAYSSSGNPSGVATFESEELENGLHTIEVRLTGTKPAGSQSTVIDIDAFEVMYDVAKDVGVSEISLDTNRKKLLEIGKTLEISSLVSPINASNKAIAWETSDNAVAIVDDGLIKGIKEGEVTIRAIATSNPDVIATVDLNVVKEIPKPDMRMRVDNENPLLIIPVYGQSYDADNSVLDWGDTLVGRWNAIPDDVKPYSVIEIHPGRIMANNIKQFYEQQAKIAEENNIPIVLVTVTAGNAIQYTGTAILTPEWAKGMLEKYSSIKGLMSTENYWIYNDSVANIIADYIDICAENGAYYIWSEHKKSIIERIVNNQKFYDAVSNNHENFIFTFKNTPVTDNAGVDSYMSGLWLTDMCAQWGGLMDTWKWYEKKYHALFKPALNTYGPGEEARAIVSEPEALLAIEMMNIYTNGGVVYNFEHPAYTTGISDQNTPAFENAILKFFRYAIENPAPSKQEIRDRTKVVISGKEGQLSTMGNFYSGLNHEDESLPTYTTGRYGIIPALPSAISEERIATFFPGATIVNKKSPELATRDLKIAFFNSKYPENYQGTAYAQFIQDVWYIYNSKVNVNENQNAKIPFKNTELDIILEPHTYIIAKEQNSTINVKLNNYRVDKDIIWEGYIPGKTPHWDTDHNTLLQEWIQANYLGNPNDDEKRTTTFTLTGLEKAPSIKEVTGLADQYDTPELKFDEETGTATITVTSNGWVDFDIVIQDQRDPATLRREISRDNPLYLMNFYWSDDVDQGDTVEKLWSAVPESLKEASVVLLIAEQSLNDKETTNPDRPAPREWLLKQTKICEENGIPYAIQVINGETKEAEKFPMEFWEELARDSKYLYGLNGAELYNRFDGGKNFGAQYMVDIINLAAEYGIYTMWTDTNIFGRSGVLVDWLEDYPELGDTMKQNKANMVLMNKESYAKPETDSLFLGMWLSEYCDNWGTSTDWWHWQLDGNGSLFDGPRGGDAWKQCLTFPDAMYVQDLLRVISMGGTAFKSEAQWYSNATNGVRTPTYQYALIPFLEKVVNGDIYIPTREEVRNMTPAVYVGQENWQVPYFDYNLSNKYPVSGRYGLIPFLPENASEKDLSFYTNVLREKKDEEYFNSLYPEKTIYTDTFSVNQGDTWYWMNSSEDKDVFLSSQFIPETNAAGLFYIGAEPHTYSVIKEESNKLDIILGNYRVDKSELWDGVTYPHGFNDPQTYEYVRKISANPNDSVKRETIIKVTGSFEGGAPRVTFEADTEHTRPYEFDEAWDEITQELVLKIRHNGHVEFSIDIDDSIEPIILAQKINIDKDIKGSIVDVGDTINFTATLIPEIASIQEVDWSIENGAGEATIDENGLFTAIKSGDVTVVATAKDGSDVTATMIINIMGETDLVTYLSDIDWKSASNGDGEVQKDKGNKGDPLNLNGVIYEKGLGTHANSTVIYELDGDYDQFLTVVGIDHWLNQDPEEVKQAGIKFDIYVDDELITSSPTMRYNIDGHTMLVDVKGASELKLVATTQVGNNWSAYANWADAKLIKYAGEEGAVVDKSKLKTLVDKAKELGKEGYTPESYAALTEALALPEDTQEEVDTKVVAIEEAIAGLVEVGDSETTPPTVVGVIPGNMATEVTTGSSIVIKFSKNVKDISPSKIRITSDSGDVEYTYSIDSHIVTLIPKEYLSEETQYRVIIEAGAVSDEVGNTLESDYTTSFTTGTSTSELKSDNANLSILTTDRGGLNPDFAPDTLGYVIRVSNKVRNITINAKTENANAIVTGIGEKSLQVGRNTIQIVVVAEDGTTTKTYTIIVTRERASDDGGSSGGSGGGGTSPTITPEVKDPVKQIQGIIKKLSTKERTEIGEEIKEYAPYATFAGNGLTVEKLEELTKGKFTKEQLEIMIKTPEILEQMGVDIGKLSMKVILTPIKDAKFKDVAPAHWASQTIKEAAELGLVAGMPDGTFAPSAELKVADTFTFLDRVLLLNGIMESNLPRSTVEKYITDKEHWAFYNMASVASKMSEESLKDISELEDRPLSRELFAQVLYEVTGGKLKPIRQTKEFVDIQDSKYQQAIDYCVKVGLLSGMSETTMSPEKPVTRAEAMSIMMRLNSLLK